MKILLKESFKILRIVFLYAQIIMELRPNVQGMH